jgi:hydroxyacylglutathione hydrolase
LELRDRVGANIYLGAAAKAAYAFTALHDGDVLEFGGIRLKALETPGHTPESVSIAVYDLNASDSQPHAVLTGDTLFIGDVGRPDLRAALGWSAAELGAKLLALLDQSLVYPAHGAGSLCGKAISKETVSTLGEQRRSNYALQPMSKEAFIQVVTADQPEAPAYFNYDAVLNSQERPTLDQALAREMNPLTLDAVLELQAAGAQVSPQPPLAIDVRAPRERDQKHIAGSLSIPLNHLAENLEKLPKDRPLLVYCAGGYRSSIAASLLQRSGFDSVGQIAGGMAGWEAAKLPVQSGRVVP